MGFLVSLAFILLALVAFGVVTHLKGNSRRFEDGLLFTPIWIISAFRLAEPDSWWARRFYDARQMEEARIRSEFRHRSDETDLEPGGSAYGLDPENLDRPENSYRCTLCGRILPTERDALRHADAIHTEVPFAEAKAAIERAAGSAGGTTTAGS